MSAAVSCSFRHRLPLARHVFALAAVLAASMSAIDPAQAQAWAGRGSWCVDPINAVGFDCSFYSYQQCMATAWGLTNSCSRNPLYVPPRTQVRHKRQRPRR